MAGPFAFSTKLNFNIFLPYNISHRTVREAVLSSEVSPNFAPSVSYTKTYLVLLMLPNIPALTLEIYTLKYPNRKHFYLNSNARYTFQMGN